QNIPELFKSDPKPSKINIITFFGAKLSTPTIEDVSRNFNPWFSPIIRVLIQNYADEEQAKIAIRGLKTRPRDDVRIAARKLMDAIRRNEIRRDAVINFKNNLSCLDKMNEDILSEACCYLGDLRSIAENYQQKSQP